MKTKQKIKEQKVRKRGIDGMENKEINKREEKWRKRKPEKKIWKRRRRKTEKGKLKNTDAKFRKRMKSEI